MSWNDPEKENAIEGVDVEGFYDTEGYSSLKKKKKGLFGLGDNFPGLPDGFGKWAGIGAALVAVMILIMVLASRDSNTVRIDPQLYQRADALQARVESLEDAVQKIDTLEQQVAALQQFQRSVDVRESDLVTRMDQIAKEMDRLSKRPAPQVAAPTVAPAQSKPAAGAAAGTGKYHVVQQGENLFRIGLKYNLSVPDIQKLNKLGPNDSIHVGQKLLVQPAR